MSAQVTQPLVAVHDSEYTRALENVNASGATPSGTGTTGKQWWPTDWHYFVMPEAVKESLRSDGTAFTVVGDSNIISGALLTNGVPKYPIVISLASEAIHDSEIAQFTNYVAAGGFLFVGSSAFTRNTNGTSRGDFAFANQMGIHSYRSALTNWGQNSSLTKQGAEHRVTSHIPDGTLTWRLPSSGDEIPWGTSPTRVYSQPHEAWQVVNSNATVLAQGDSFPFLTVKPYGKGYFIYCAAMQPLLGNGGWAPAMYAYLIMRRSIEWAFESSGVPVAKLSPWPFQYDAAIMVRHDLENLSNEVAAVEASAQFEATNGAKGDYYFCTGTLREDMSPMYNTNTVVQGLRRAMTNYGATIGPHNGGGKNTNNLALVRGDYDYWHWGTDEPLDLPGGSNYSYVSMSSSFANIETWLSGLMTNGMRTWVAPYFDATREGSLNIQAHLGVKIAGEQKVGPFPHWTLSTQVANKRFGILSEPLSDWFVGSQISHSMEAGHSVATVRAEVDFYYGQGFLINQYSHSLSHGVGPTPNSAAAAQDYITYSFNTNRFPRLWSQNGIGVYNWWLQRSNVQVTASYATNGNQCTTTLGIKNSSNPNTAVEIGVPVNGLYSGLQVFTNGVLAGTSQYRTNGSLIKLRVGTTVTNAVVSYLFCPLGENTQMFVQNFDGVSTPGLPSGWSSATSGGGTAWVTQSAVRHTLPNAAFAAETTTVGLSDLVSPVIAVPPGVTRLAFQNYYNLEVYNGTAYDGGVLEIKVGTNGFADILTAGGVFESGAYTHVLTSGTGNALAGRAAWSGDAGGFVPTVVKLPANAGGDTIQLRWRCSTDTGGTAAGWRVDSITLSNQLCLCCVVATNPPVLPTQTNRTVAELTLLTVNNAATDADLPNDSLQYVLVNPPAGAAIDGNGLISWTPSEAQGPGNYTLTTIVTDSANLSATNSFSVTVNDVNSPPSFPSPGNRTVAEQTLMTVTNTATDSDLPANTLTYSLLAFPSGVTINPNTGVITWSPTEAQGPGNYPITTRVVDNGTPNLSATNTFTVTVTEVNLAPSFLATPANRTINEMQLLTVTNAATDPDQPANVLSYQLLNPPAGAAINSSGVFTWMPDGSQGPSTNAITTIVTDDGTPALSKTNTFNVVVLDTVLCQYVSIYSENFDGVTAPALPAQWTTSASGGQSPWLTTNTTSHTAPNAAFSRDPATAGTNALVSPSLDLPSGDLVLTFRHNYQLETNFDGGVLEIKIGTNNFADILAAGGSFVSGGYNRVINATDSGLSGKAAWSGGSGGYVTTVVNLPAAAGGTTNQIRWRCITDTGNGEPVIGWRVDTVAISNLVCGVNTAPALPAPTNRTLAELTTLSVTNTATDADVPANTLTYSLLVFPTGATINTNTGVITWMPSEAQGPSVNTFTTVVTDDGSPAMSDTNSFTVTVTEVNDNAPIFVSTPTNRTIAELTTLAVTNAATDADIPANTLTYSLLVAPAGATINTNSGVITWTPSEAQGPSSSNLFTTRVTDNGSPALNATNTFYVSVTETNDNAPIFVSTPADRTIVELTTLTVTNAATDADIPANTLTYSLLAAPAGATINTNTGVIVWTPSEAQGPSSSNAFITRVTDNGSPALNATNTFYVSVTETNDNAPILAALPDLTIAELTTLTVTNVATDADIPANPLTYSLLAAPEGATINTNTGVIAWTPSEAQGPSTNTFTTVVTDEGSPALSATNTFLVEVTEVNEPPVLPVQNDVTIAEFSTLTVTNTATDPDLPPDSMNYLLGVPPYTLAYGVTGLPNAVISTNGIITWTPGEADGPGSYVLTTIVTDGGGLSATNSFTVTVTELNAAPQLPAQADRTIAEGAPWTVSNTATDSDLPVNGLSYQLLSAPTNAAISATGIITWTPATGTGGSTNVFTTVVTDDGVPALSATNTFFVVIKVPTPAPVIESITMTNGIVTLTWSAVAGELYRLQYQDSVTATNWIDLMPDVPAIGATASGTNDVAGATQRYYRIWLVPQE